MTIKNNGFHIFEVLQTKKIFYEGRNWNTSILKTCLSLLFILKMKKKKNWTKILKSVKQKLTFLIFHQLIRIGPIAPIINKLPSFH